MADKLIPCIPKYKPQGFVRMLSEVEDYNLKMMNIPMMWKTTKGKGIRVAVLDTGTPTHDDVPVKDKYSCVPNYMFDENGHGTASASVIGAIAGNGMGVAGVAPECELYTCAVLNKQGSGRAEWIVDGIKWAVDCAKAHIINMSLGMPKAPISKKLLEACEYAHSKGVVVVAASGNDHGPVCQPAIYDTVISVGAVDADKSLANFSNMGDELDFVAGGVACYMAYLHNGYAKQSGTCLKEGTLIYTPTGPVAIEHVKPGTEVYAYKDGRVVRRTVAANLNQGKNMVYRLISRGRAVWATSTHKFLTFNQGTKDIGWTPLNELTKQHRLPLKVGFDVDVNPYLDKVVPEDLAWLMGFFLGDGWLCHVDGTILKTSYECMSESLLHRLMVMADYDGFMHSKLWKRVRPNLAPNSEPGKLSTSYCTTVHEYRPPYGANCVKTTTSADGVPAEVKGKDVLLDYFPDGDFCLGLWNIEEGTEHEANVYDLTVPDADCFVAEGLIVHNSFAAPALAGVAALIMSEALNGPDKKLLTPEEVYKKLEDISVDLGDLGKDFKTGNGIPLFGYTNPDKPGPAIPEAKSSSLAIALAELAPANILESFSTALKEAAEIARNHG